MSTNVTPNDTIHEDLTEERYIHTTVFTAREMVDMAYASVAVGKLKGPFTTTH